MSDLVDNPDDDVADVILEAARKEYHREKSKETIEGWKSLGVKSVNVLAPMRLANWFKAAAAQMVAVEMMNQVNAYDDHTLSVLGNRKPKYTVTIETLDILRDAVGDNELALAEVAKMESLLREARNERAAGLSPDTDPDMVLYYLAREYVIVKYVRGLYDMLRYHLKNGFGEMPAITAELDLSSKVRNVL